MSNTQDENKNNEKLGLASSTLKINRSFDNSTIKQNFAQGRSNSVTIEVKRKRFAVKDSDDTNLDGSTKLKKTGDELNSRLYAIQQAAQQAEQEEHLKQESEKKRQATIQEAKEEQAKQLEKQDEVEILQQAPDNQAFNKNEENILNQDATNNSVAAKIVNPEIKETHKKKVENLDDSKHFNKPETKTKSAVKNKYDDSKKIAGKLNSFTNLGEDEDFDSPRPRSMAALKRQREKFKRDNQSNIKAPEKITKEVTLPETITVQELANRMSARVADVTKELMKLGMLVTGSQIIDADTAELIISSFGHTTKRVTEGDVENILQFNDQEQDLEKRSPVVTIMGHVDHGKTSLLDALRSSDVALGEAGGITQHIGAYQITLANAEHITFIDTPGHEAFTAMRSRGAKATDIVVLVVAADDGIMAQTIEAINHAKAAEVPIIVAINKIDKPGADVTRVKNELLQHSLVSEELGGDTLIVEVSAKQKTNLDKLEETILLQAEMLNLRANINAKAGGIVIESKVDKARGVITTLLVQRGTLRVGDLIVAGGSYGKARVIHDDKWRTIKEAIPSMPVEVLGLDYPSDAGETFNVVDQEKQAREITEYRNQKKALLKNALNKRGSLEEFFSRSSDGKIKDLPIIIKADVQGSIEAISGSLQKFNGDEVKVKILHSAVGGITESDITLAKASKAILLGFNVRANPQARQQADSEGIDIHYYSVIYNLIDDIKAILSGMLSPMIREEFIGMAEIRKVYNITKAGKIAGSLVTNGYISKGAGVRLLRDNIVIHEGKLKTLKRFKEDVKEVKNGFECGIAFENYEDIREGDKVEVFQLIEEARTI
jgi:translation initiation factor IF-2